MTQPRKPDGYILVGVFSGSTSGHAPLIPTAINWNGLGGETDYFYAPIGTGTNVVLRAIYVYIKIIK